MTNIRYGFAWVKRPEPPQGAKGQSQPGQKGPQLEVGAQRAPRLLVHYKMLQKTEQFNPSLEVIFGSNRSSSCSHEQLFSYSLGPMPLCHKSHSRLLWQYCTISVTKLCQCITTQLFSHRGAYPCPQTSLFVQRLAILSSRSMTKLTKSKNF